MDFISTNVYISEIYCTYGDIILTEISFSSSSEVPISVPLSEDTSTVTLSLPPILNGTKMYCPYLPLFLCKLSSVISGTGGTYIGFSDYYGLLNVDDVYHLFPCKILIIF